MKLKLNPNSNCGTVIKHDKNIDDNVVINYEEHLKTLFKEVEDEELIIDDETPTNQQLLALNDNAYELMKKCIDRTVEDSSLDDIKKSYILMGMRSSIMKLLKESFGLKDYVDKCINKLIGIEQL